MNSFPHYIFNPSPFSLYLISYPRLLSELFTFFNKYSSMRIFCPQEIKACKDDNS